jgi:predicted N-formylglutamate amidohydrolase
MTQHKGLNPKRSNLVITCEHGGKQVPPPYRRYFHNCQSLLNSHRGFDFGALVMARALARHFSAPIVSSTVSRLLVDLNRSPGHRDLHMKAVRDLPADTRQRIVAEHYQPFRKEAQKFMAEAISRAGIVTHISCHSFTHSLDGVVRQADIGLLYDPTRAGERALSAHWKSTLTAYDPDLVVRRNYPYQGRNDGLTSFFRKAFPPECYLGIELELNQRNLRGPSRKWAPLRKAIILSLDEALARNGQ